MLLTSTKVYGTYNDDSTSASLGFPVDTYYNIFIPLKAELKTEEVSAEPVLPDRPSKKTFIYVNPWTYWNTDTKLASIRLQRDYLLSKSDWIVSKYAETLTEVPQNWRDYRQQLRDFPSTVDVNLPIEQIVWPVSP